MVQNNGGFPDGGGPVGSASFAEKLDQLEDMIGADLIITNTSFPLTDGVATVFQLDARCECATSRQCCTPEHSSGSLNCSGIPFGMPGPPNANGCNGRAVVGSTAFPPWGDQWLATWFPSVPPVVLDLYSHYLGFMIFDAPCAISRGAFSKGTAQVFWWI